MHKPIRIFSCGAAARELCFAALATALLAFSGPSNAQSGGLGERITLRPGESATFILTPGHIHPRLQRVSPIVTGAITVVYDLSGSEGRLTARSRSSGAVTLAVFVVGPPSSVAGDAYGGSAEREGDASEREEPSRNITEAAPIRVGGIQLSGNDAPVSLSWRGRYRQIEVGDVIAAPRRRDRPAGQNQ